MLTHNSTRPRPDAIVVSIAVLCFPLFVYGLGSTYLWQDEAQTALLARSVLAHGVPIVGVGSESLSAVGGTDAGVRGVYFQIAWLQAYLVAASFAIFGESSWSARLVFAIAGWLCVPLVAWTTRQAGASRSAARLAALLTGLSVPFIVCSRQARYYALTAALVLLVTGTYAKLAAAPASADRAKRTAEPFAFGAAAVLLVLSFDVTAIGILAILALHWMVTTSSGNRWNTRFWLPWGAACAILIGWLGLSFTAASRRSQGDLRTLYRRFAVGIPFYLAQINAHVMPLPLLATVAFLKRRSGEWHTAGLLSAVIAGGLAGAMLSPVRFFRYAVPVVPVILALAALGLDALGRRHRAGAMLAAAIVVLVVTSTAPFVWSNAVLSSVARQTGVFTVRGRVYQYRIPLADLFQELRDPPKGPVAAVVEYLRQHARVGDVVVASYGELPLRFHTPLTVYGGETAQWPAAGVTPNWLWRRHGLSNVWIRASESWIDAELGRHSYEPIELRTIDRRWENREDPEEHIFSNPGPAGPPVVIYRLRSGAE